MRVTTLINNLYQVGYKNQSSAIRTKRSQSACFLSGEVEELESWAEFCTPDSFGQQWDHLANRRHSLAVTGRAFKCHLQIFVVLNWY